MIQRILALPSNIPAALTGGGLFLLSLLLLNFGALLSLAVGVGGYLVSGLLIFPAEPPQEAKQKRRLGAVVKHGQQKLADMRALQREIHQPDVREKIATLCTVGANIFDALKKNPQHVNAVARFSEYYLDTTMKLIKNYIHLSEHQTYSADAQTSLIKVNRMLTDIQLAYEKQLNSVLQDVVVDLDADIAMLEESINIEKM